MKQHKNHFNLTSYVKVVDFQSFWMDDIFSSKLGMKIGHLNENLKRKHKNKNKTLDRWNIPNMDENASNGMKN